MYFIAYNQIYYYYLYFNLNPQLNVIGPARSEIMYTALIPAQRLARAAPAPWHFQQQDFKRGNVEGTLQ